MLMCLGSVSGLFYGEMQHHSSRRNSLFHFPVLFTGVEGGEKNLSTSCRMIWFEIWWARRLDATSRSCAHSDAVCWDRCHPAQRVTAAARWFNTMTLCSLAFHVEACSGKKERKKERGKTWQWNRGSRSTRDAVHFASFTFLIYLSPEAVRDVNICETCSRLLAAGSPWRGKCRSFTRVTKLPMREETRREKRRNPHRSVRDLIDPSFTSHFTFDFDPHWLWVKGRCSQDRVPKRGGWGREGRGGEWCWQGYWNK